MTQALYRKWRPQTWQDVVGQQHIVQTLRNAIRADRVAHAYLFAGPRGTGKTTAARLLAKAVNCLAEDPASRPCNQCDHCQAVNENRFLDLIEIDAASNTSVEDVRDLRDKINFSPNQGRYKVYIIDEVHMLSTAAFNALLKTLEEPPAHAIFILATTEINKIPATVLSRCQRHEFRRVPVDDIVTQLQKIVETEKLTITPDALASIARQSAGGLRDAISLLDQLASTGQPITLDLTQEILGTATSQTVLALVHAVLEGTPSKALDAVHAALDGGTDPRVLARQVVDYLRAVLLIQMGNAAQADLAADTRKQAEKHARAFSLPDVLRLIKAFNGAAVDLRGGWQPALPLELAIADALGTSAATQEPRAKVEAEPKEVKPQEAPRAPSAGEQKKAAASAASGEAGFSLDQISKVWKSVKAAIRKESPGLEALLNSGKLLEIKEDVLVLGFASDLLRTKVDTPEQMEIVRRALVEVLGRELQVRCVVSGARQAAPPDVKSDGMVAAALKAGGKIVDIQE
jgi:DNA polymerase-3 subunit gamma/tau